MGVMGGLGEMADHRRAHGRRNEQKWTMERIKKETSFSTEKKEMETMMNGRNILYKKCKSMLGQPDSEGGLEVRKRESRDNKNREKEKGMMCIYSTRTTTVKARLGGGTKKKRIDESPSTSTTLP